MTSDPVFPLAFRGYALGFAFARMLARAALLSFVKRWYQARYRGLKALDAAAFEAAERMNELSEALGGLDADIDSAFSEITKREEDGERS